MLERCLIWQITRPENTFYQTKGSETDCDCRFSGARLEFSYVGKVVHSPLRSSSKYLRPEEQLRLMVDTSSQRHSAERDTENPLTFG